MPKYGSRSRPSPRPKTKPTSRPSAKPKEKPRIKNESKSTSESSASTGSNNLALATGFVIGNTMHTNSSSISSGSVSSSVSDLEPFVAYAPQVKSAVDYDSDSRTEDTDDAGSGEEEVTSDSV